MLRMICGWKSTHGRPLGITSLEKCKLKSLGPTAPPMVTLEKCLLDSCFPSLELISSSTTPRHRVSECYTHVGQSNSSESGGVLL